MWNKADKLNRFDLNIISDLMRALADTDSGIDNINMISKCILTHFSPLLAQCDWNSVLVSTRRRSVMATVRTGRRKMSEFFNSPKLFPDVSQGFGGGGVLDLLPTFVLDSKTDKITRSHIFRGGVWPTYQLLFLSPKVTKSEKSHILRGWVWPSLSLKSTSPIFFGGLLTQLLYRSSKLTKSHSLIFWWVESSGGGNFFCWVQKWQKSSYFGGGKGGNLIQIERWIQLVETNLSGLIISRLFCRYTCRSRCHPMSVLLSFAAGMRFRTCIPLHNMRVLFCQHS